MSKKPGLRFVAGRAWNIWSEERCVLCDQVTRTFSFSDNEGYDEESLCLECLQDAVELLQAKAAGGSQDAPPDPASGPT